MRMHTPPACESKALMAWVRLQQADLKEARTILDGVDCSEPREMGARFAMLRSQVAVLQDEMEEARKWVHAARASPIHYEEDQGLLQSVLQQVDPGYLPMFSGKADLAGGGTSDARAGSPVDPAQGNRVIGSPLGQADLQARAVFPMLRTVRPSLEMQFRMFRLLSHEQRVDEFSYMQPTLHAGLLLGDAFPRLLATFTHDALRVDAGDRFQDGPLWFSEAHRGDFEIELTPTLYAFGGVGRRTYREAGRTRLEVEGGLASGTSLRNGTRLLAGLSGRFHDAINPAHDARGATVVLQAQVPMPVGFELRQSAAVSLDVFPSSKGFFSVEGGNRHDGLIRHTLGLWSTSLNGLRAGLDYAYSHRRSTAEAYGFSDHRVLLHVTWAMDSDRVGKISVSGDNRVPMPYGQAASGVEDTRIRDLMRQDEAVKRGSSCLK